MATAIRRAIDLGWDVRLIVLPGFAEVRLHRVSDMQVDPPPGLVDDVLADVRRLLEVD